MKDEQLNEVTREILLRTSYLKECVKKSTVIGDEYIIRGIIFFDEVLKMINPLEINEEIIEEIQMHINDILYEKEMLFNKYYNLGINRCYFILYDYNIAHKTRKLG